MTNERIYNIKRVFNGINWRNDFVGLDKGAQMSKCFLCKRNEKQVLLIRLPFETKYKRACLEIIGNAIENEFICLPCMGYEFDKAMDRLEREKA